MWDIETTCLPHDLNTLFHFTEREYLFQTRSMAQNFASENRAAITDTHGKNSLRFFGPKVLNKLKRLPLFQSASSKEEFVNKYKAHLLSST